MVLNKTIMMGRMVADPELKKTNSDMAVCNFTLAVDKPKGRMLKMQKRILLTAWHGVEQQKSFASSSIKVVVFIVRWCNSEQEPIKDKSDK